MKTNLPGLHTMRKWKAEISTAIKETHTGPERPAFCRPLMHWPFGRGHTSVC